MKRAASIAAGVFLAFNVGSSTGFAQSSGNFSYATTGNDNFVGCTLNNSGSIAGGFQCQQSCALDSSGVSQCTPASGECMGTAVAGIKTSSGNGNVFVVRPSAVIGLLTNASVNSKQGTTG